MSATKKAIKSIGKKIHDGELDDALRESTEALKGAKESDPDLPSLIMFRGLVFQHLKKPDETEKCYIHAYRLDPSLSLVHKAIPKLFRDHKQWDKLARFLETKIYDTYNGNDADACAAALNELLKIRQEHGQEEKLYHTLGLLLPSSPLISLLTSATPPAGSYTPFAMPEYPPQSYATIPSLPSPIPHPVHLINSLPLLLHLLIRLQVIVHTTVESQVKAGRQRIGGGTEKEVRKRVEAEVLGGPVGMNMVELLREVSNHPEVPEEIRRDVEVREFGFWRKLVAVLKPESEAKSSEGKEKGGKTGKPAEETNVDKSGLPPSPFFAEPGRARPSKYEALSRANGLADGFVLLGLTGPGVEEGWQWVLDGKDESSILYDLEFLHKYAKTFPDTPMTDFIDDYCRWFKLPLPEPEDEATTEQESDEKVKAEKQSKKEKFQRWRKKKKGPNARERRKARRQAGKEGVLAEDLDQEERDELISSMTKLLDKLKSSVFAHRVMARISIQEEDWANAISFAEKARALVREVEKDRGVTLKQTKLSVETALAVALVPYFAPKHHPQATKLFKTVLDAQPDNIEARFARARIYQDAEKWQEAQKNFQLIIDQGGGEKDMVAAREELGWCLVNQGKLDEGRDVLEAVVELRDSRHEKLEDGKEDDEAFLRARAWWRLGQTEWKIGDDESRAHAQEWFMASMRALPTFAPAFSALGICYSSASPPDEDRALKCFQKAFELDATEADAARRLAIGYANDDEWAQVRLIANRVMEGEGGLDGVAGGEVMNAKGRFAPKNGWAWKALGATEMHYKNYTRAAQALQIALRANDADLSIWVMLGEAYVKAGRHNAGLKALQQALELDPKHWIALYHVADIHAQLGSYEQAIETYTQILAITGDGEIGVVSAMATTELALGRQAAAGGFRERSRRAFHASLDLAHKVLKQGLGHRPWAWKVIGDATFELAGHESTIAAAEETSDVLRSILEHLVEDDTARRSAVEGLGHAANLLQTAVDLTHTSKTAIFAYAYRAHLLKNEPRVADPALYDLASALHALGLKLQPDSTEKTACMKAAIAAIRLALERDAGDERLWNALAVICGDGGAQMAQHAFVVSLELYQKDPIVWTNLGYLYLRLDDRELANQCFLKAQVMDPDHAAAWLGQGMLADRNGDKDHARNLFAHSVTLSGGSLLEADLAMAVSTFAPFLRYGAPADTGILHQPAFALRHYTHQRPSDSSAAHLYALICERLGLVDEAVTALEKASELLEQEFEHAESPEIEHRYITALLNLGRVRLAGRAYDQSLEAFTNCFELLGGSQHPDAGKMRVQARLGQGLAQFWIGQVDESLEAFQHALDECSGQGEKELVAVLLARTLWGLGGDEAKDLAKSQLMECLSSENPSVSVIATLAACAITSSDTDLIEAAISELHQRSPQIKLVQDPSGQSDLVLFMHSLSQCPDQADEAVAILQAAVQQRPADPIARNRLAKALVASGSYDEAKFVLDGVASQDGATLSEALRLRGVAQVVNGDSEGSGMVQKGVVVRPWEQAGWEALAWARGVQTETG